MNEDKLSREQRAAAASVKAASYVKRRCQTFYEARNGITVKMTREDLRAAQERVSK